MVYYQWLDFRLACSVPEAYLQRARGDKSSFIGYLGHIHCMSYSLYKLFVTTKNPAYGRHQLSQLMRIVGPIQF